MRKEHSKTVFKKKLLICSFELVVRKKLRHKKVFINKIPKIYILTLDKLN